MGKLTQQRINTLTRRLATGIPRKIACEQAGIPQSTFYYWMRQGREHCDDGTNGNSVYARLFRSVNQTEGELIRRWQTMVETGKHRDIQFLLERRFPQYYGRANRGSTDLDLEQQTQTVDPITVLIETLTDIVGKETDDANRTTNDNDPSGG